MKRFFVISVIFVFSFVFAGEVRAQALIDPVKYGVSKNVDPSWKVRKVDMGGSFIIAYGNSSPATPEIESRFNTKSNVVEIAVTNGGEKNTSALEEAKKRAIELSYKIGQELPTSCGAQYCYAKSHIGSNSSPGPAPAQIASVPAPKVSVAPAKVPVAEEQSSLSGVTYTEEKPCKCKEWNKDKNGECNCDMQRCMETDKVVYMLRWVSPYRFSKSLSESGMNHVTFHQKDKED